MESVLFKESEFEIPQERESFQKIFQLLSEKFGLDAFARYRDGLAQGRLAPAYFEAVIGGALSNVDAIAKKSPKTLKQALASLVESSEFREVTGPGANTIEKLRKRIQLVSECFR
jgi:hypothetical protein